MEDPVTAEARMGYLIRVLNHLNDENPDLVLMQNLAFFEKDAKNWLVSAVHQEAKKLVNAHRNKPLGDSTTLEEFFDPPPMDQATEIFECSAYARVIVNAIDLNTGEVIGIMS